jgi:hypothetical protein
MPPLTRLRSIEFIIFGSAIRIRWITQILSHISSARLENVVFKLRSSHRGEVSSGDVSNTLEWQNVDAVLQRPTFSSLRHVHLMSTYGTDVPLSPLGHIPQLLPQCHARGIVRVN